MESNPLAGLLGLLMLLQLVVVLAVLLGGLYALYCFNRAATGLDRLATAVEFWVEHAAQTQMLPEAAPDVLRPLPAQNSTPSNTNDDWMKPIELPVARPASKEENQPLDSVESVESRDKSDSHKSDQEVRHD